MPESTSNVEFAHRIHEHGHRAGLHGGAEWLEMLEAVVLAAVAVLTAFSGYQAAKWDARSAASYARASALTAQAQEEQTLAGQEHLYDIVTFNAWLDAAQGGRKELAAVLERRFRPEYRAAYDAWLKTDPLTNPAAPPGPSFMPGYANAHLASARALSRKAHEAYEGGVSNRETGDDYVRVTVVLATVLLLIAISQRFRIRAARVGLIAIASVMLITAIFRVVGFPRA
jgi:hypothetical protein